MLFRDALKISEFDIHRLSFASCRKEFYRTVVIARGNTGFCRQARIMRQGPIRRRPVGAHQENHRLDSMSASTVASLDFIHCSEELSGFVRQIG